MTTIRVRETTPIKITGSPGAISASASVKTGPQGPAGPTGPGADVTAAQINAARDAAIAARDAAQAVGTTNDTVIAGRLGDTTSAAYAAAATKFQRVGGRYKKWTDLPEPFYIPHRGAGPAIAPDNTMEAFRIGHSMDLGVVDGGDIRVLPDGTFANMHDRDMRFTNLAGTGTNVDDLSGPGWANLVIDGTKSTGAGWPTNMKAPTGRQIWDELGDKTLLSPEWKQDGGDPLGYQAMIDYMVRAGMGERVLFNSFNLPACQYAVANGIPNACWNLPTAANTTANLAALAGTGVKYVGMSGVPAANIITAYISAGYKAIIGPVGRLNAIGNVSMASVAGLGVSGFYLDDPLYESGQTSKYRVTVAPWTKSGTFYHGHKGSDALRGTFVGSPGFWRFQVPVADRFFLLGWACPLVNAAASYTLTVPIVFDAIGANTTRHADVVFGALRDEWLDFGVRAEFTGYQAITRANGQITLYKYVNGSLSQIGTVTSSAIQQVTLSAGLTAGAAVTSLPVNALTAATVAGAQWALPNGQIVTASAGAASGATAIPVTSVTPLTAVASGTLLPQQATVKIDVTPTAITVTRTDVATSNTFTVADTTYRGAFAYVGVFGTADGFLPSFGKITVT
jgi:glycerophosphoryl diester phosphodiesterase